MLLLSRKRNLGPEGFGWRKAEIVADLFEVRGNVFAAWAVVNRRRP
jgi:hypothetical protein